MTEPSLYTTASEVWQALANAKAGPERAAIIQPDQNRDLILNSGSFVVFLNGEVNDNAATFQEKLSAVRITQSQRLRTLKDGNIILDGKGSFGGMSERTPPDAELNQDLLNKKDDLQLADDGSVIRITDLNEIARRTAARETMEEISEIVPDQDIDIKMNITKDGLRYVFAENAITRIPLGPVKDDNYVINMWTGDLSHPAYAVTPYGHSCRLETEAFDHITSIGHSVMVRGWQDFNNDPMTLKGREVLGVEAIPLFNALTQWGKKTPQGDVDLSHDYRYPQEWFALWQVARNVLGINTKQDFVSLASEAQRLVINNAVHDNQTPHQIDFIGALRLMNGGSLSTNADVKKFEDGLHLPQGTFQAMEKACSEVMTKAGFKPLSPSNSIRPAGQRFTR